MLETIPWAKVTFFGFSPSLQRHDSSQVDIRAISVETEFLSLEKRQFFGVLISYHDIYFALYLGSLTFHRQSRLKSSLSSDIFSTGKKCSISSSPMVSPTSLRWLGILKLPKIALSPSNLGKR